MTRTSRTEAQNNSVKRRVAQEAEESAALLDVKVDEGGSITWEGRRVGAVRESDSGHAWFGISPHQEAMAHPEQNPDAYGVSPQPTPLAAAVAFVEARGASTAGE